MQVIGSGIQAAKVCSPFCVQNNNVVKPPEWQMNARKTGSDGKNQTFAFGIQI
jgi:hypothetical protein